MDSNTAASLLAGSIIVVGGGAIIGSALRNMYKKKAEAKEERYQKQRADAKYGPKPVTFQDEPYAGESPPVEPESVVSSNLESKPEITTTELRPYYRWVSLKDYANLKDYAKRLPWRVWEAPSDNPDETISFVRAFSTRARAQDFISQAKHDYPYEAYPVKGRFARKR